MPRSAGAADARYTNRLIHETSPYLLQHAHNPVDWYPWGDAAFEEAARTDKPIFLSVGYATCYWCHVMERQVFESPRIAEQMNQQFVNIKVDREERPDVDELYMTATQLMTQHGGWPMSVFLTPPPASAANTHEAAGLEPFWAGTYIPPEPMRGMPGFPQLLQGITDAWQNRRNDVLDQARRVSEAVREYLRHHDTTGPLAYEMVQRALAALMSQYDAWHGGIGGAPKFPQPSFLALWLAMWRHTGDEQPRQALTHTLDRMARGGIYDQVGGGFHRYATDAEWLVPHFEKMLYDNGQLVELYTEACESGLSARDRALYERIVRETCDYVLREMTDATGAFWSAQDAEVDGREGGNYLWTRQEIERTLDDSELAQLAVKMYGLDRGTNFQDPHHPDAAPANVLYIPEPLDQLARELDEAPAALEEKRRRINEQLKRVRDQRRQPATDDKVLVEWNGMMIAGLARAGRALGEPRYLRAARQAAEAILEHMTGPEDALYRTWRDGQAKIPAFLTDYAFFVHGLIELHRAAPAEDAQAAQRDLDLARRYTVAAIDRFAAEQGGYYDTRADQSDLFVRVRSTQDGVIPSGNSQMLHNLIDLYQLTGDAAWFERALVDARSFGQLLETRSVALVHMQHALLRLIQIDADRVESDTPSAGSPSAADEGPVAVRVEPGRVDLSSGEAAFTVTLTIESSHHVNAADPGVPELIPTELLLRGARGLALEVRYPDGESRALPYADQPVAIYEGEVSLQGVLRREAEAPRADTARLVLRYQACTDQQCLPPQLVEVPVQIVGL